MPRCGCLRQDALRRLNGEAQALVVLDGGFQIRDPVHEMIELHSHILRPRQRCENLCTPEKSRVSSRRSPGVVPPEAQAAAVHERVVGSPLFVREIVRLLPPSPPLSSAAAMRRSPDDRQFPCIRRRDGHRDPCLLTDGWSRRAFRRYRLVMRPFGELIRRRCLAAIVCRARQGRPQLNHDVLALAWDRHRVLTGDIRPAAGSSSVRKSSPVYSPGSTRTSQFPESSRITASTP